MIEFQCSCGTRMRTPPENAGKKTRCKNCSALVAIPNAEEPPKPTAAQKTAAHTVRATPVQAKPVQARPIQAKPVQAPTTDPLSSLPRFDPLGDPFLMGGPLGNPIGNAWAASRPQKSRHSPWIAVLAVVASISVVGVIGGAIAIVNLVSKASLSSAKKPLADANNVSPTSNPTKPKPAATVSDAEALDVANRFVSAVKSGDMFTCDRILNIDNLINSIAVEVQMSERDKRSFVAGFRTQPSLAQQVHQATRQGGDYTVLRAVKRDGQTRVIVRLSSEQAGLNYHELMMDRSPSGEVIVADVYILTLGEAFGETIRRVVIMMAASQNQSLLARLSGSRKTMAQHGNTLSQISRLSKVSPSQTLAEMKKLPSELQQEKTIMIVKLAMSAQMGDAEHQAAFEEFRRLFPTDPSLDLHSIDYHIARNETDQAIAAVQRLLNYLGGDSMLEELLINLRK